MAATSGGECKLRQLDNVTDASTYKLDVSESASDAEPVRFFRHDNALPNEPSCKRDNPDAHQQMKCKCRLKSIVR